MQDIRYHECRQRGTVDFPIEYHYVDHTHPQYEMPFHWHIEYEIIRILDGEFGLFLDGTEYLLQKDDIAFIKDGKLHGGSPKDCTYECIVFDFNILRQRSFLTDSFLKKIAHQKISINPVHNRSCITSPLITMFEAIRSEAEGYELSVLGSLLLFFAALQQNECYSEAEESELKSQKSIEQLKASLELIVTDYAKPLTLQELSRVCGLSPKYFCRFFQEYTNRTPIDYLNYYRIEQACYQISQSEDTLTDIAFRCGFNDFSYFIKTFKKYKGITPKKYQMMWKE